MIFRDEKMKAKTKAELLAEKNIKYEKKTKMKRIPIHRGYLLVPVEKYEANKEHYDKLSGWIPIE